MTSSKEVIRLSERQLVLKAKSGDKNAFCELYTIYKDKLYRYAFYLTVYIFDAGAMQDTKYPG